MPVGEVLAEKLRDMPRRHLSYGSIIAVVAAIPVEALLSKIGFGLGRFSGLGLFASPVVSPQESSPGVLRRDELGPVVRARRGVSLGRRPADYHPRFRQRRGHLAQGRPEARLAGVGHCREPDDVRPEPSHELTQLDCLGSRSDVGDSISRVPKAKRRLHQPQLVYLIGEAGAYDVSPGEAGGLVQKAEEAGPHRVGYEVLLSRAQLFFFPPAADLYLQGSQHRAPG